MEGKETPKGKGGKSGKEIPKENKNDQQGLQRLKAVPPPHQTSQIPSGEVFFNKKYKGFRPKYACETLGLRYKVRSKFSPPMGEPDLKDPDLGSGIKEWRYGVSSESEIDWIRVGKGRGSKLKTATYIKVYKTCSSPRRTFFLHALSFECTSKLCIAFLNQFSVYFHIKRMHNTF